MFHNENPFSVPANLGNIVIAHMFSNPQNDINEFYIIMKTKHLPTISKVL